MNILEERKDVIQDYKYKSSLKETLALCPTLSLSFSLYPSIYILGYTKHKTSLKKEQTTTTTCLEDPQKMVALPLPLQPPRLKQNHSMNTI